MPNRTQSYNLAVVQDLLLAAFTADDLRRLVLYTSRQALKPIIHQFASGDGLTAMAEKAITYCHKQDCFADLLAEVKRINPRQYARFEAQLLSSSEATQADSTSASPPPGPTGGTTYVTHIQHAQGIAIGDGARVITGHPPEREDDID